MNIATGRGTGVIDAYDSRTSGMPYPKAKPVTGREIMITTNVQECLTLEQSLYAAAGRNDIDFVEEALAGSFGELQASWLHNVLLDAAKCGNAGFVDILLDANVSVLTKDRFGHTAFMTAVRWGHTEFVEKLLIRGFPVSNHKDCIKALHMACQLDYVDILKLLLAHTTTDHVNTAFRSHARGEETLLIKTVKSKKPRQIEVMKLLLNAGANVDMKTNGCSVIHVAIWHGGPELFCILLEANADVNSRDGFGITPFWLAYSYSKLNHMKLLLQYGADPSLGVNYQFWFPELTKEATGFKQVSRIHTLHIPTIKMLYTVWSYTDLHSLEEWLTSNCIRPDVITLLHELGFAPRSLLSTCRLAVRDAMRVRGPNGINCLPLPNTLKEYLLFSDINVQHSTTDHTSYMV